MTTLMRTLRAVTAGALVALVVAAPASAASVKLSGGSTTLKLDAGTAKALEGLGVAVTPIKPAKAGSQGVSFPITGGGSTRPPRRERAPTAAACRCARARRASA